MDFKMIPITKPFIEKKDIKFIKKVFNSKILTDGYFQKECEKIIKKKLNSKFVALTHSCTAALEISALLINGADSLMYNPFKPYSTTQYSNIEPLE